MNQKGDYPVWTQPNQIRPLKEAQAQNVISKVVEQEALDPHSSVETQI